MIVLTDSSPFRIQTLIQSHRCTSYAAQAAYDLCTLYTSFFVVVTCIMKCFIFSAFATANCSWFTSLRSKKKLSHKKKKKKERGKQDKASFCEAVRSILISQLLPNSKRIYLFAYIYSVQVPAVYNLTIFTRNTSFHFPVIASVS